MLLLGLLLLVAAGALTGGLLVDNTADSKAEIFGFSLPHLTIGQLFLVGVGTGFVATLGLALLLAGMRRSGRKRRQQRQEIKTKRQSEEQLKEENVRLARELEQQRYSAPPPTAPTAQTPTAPTTAPTTGATAVDAPGSTGPSLQNTAEERPASE